MTKKYSYIPWILPSVFLVYASVIALSFHDSLSLDGYVNLVSGEILLKTLSHSGLASLTWPPLYSLLISLFSFEMGLHTGAKVVSLLSGAGLLVLLPYLSRSIEHGFLPGVLVQVLLAVNPYFLRICLEAENHMLDAFLVTGAAVFAVQYFHGGSFVSLPIWFIFFTVLACLTRYPSWVLTIAFMVTVTTKNQGWTRLKVPISVFGYVLAANSVWFVYNHLTTGYFISSFKGRGGVIAVGLLENGLLNASLTEIILSKNYTIEASELLLNYPTRYVTHFCINLMRFFEFTIYKFPPLSFFSFLIFVGMIILLVKLGESEFLFLSILLVIYSSLTILTRFSWAYFLHLGVILSTIGVAYLLELSRVAFSDNNFARWGILSILLGVFFYQCNLFYIDLQDFMDNKFSSWKPVEPLEQNFEKFTKKTAPKSTTEVMASIHLVPTIFRLNIQHNFNILVAPIPSLPAKNILCYGNITNHEKRVLKFLNYPPNMNPRKLSPPDYFVLSGTYYRLLEKKGALSSRGLMNYMRPVSWWESEGYFKLYRVQIDSCK